MFVGQFFDCLFDYGGQEINCIYSITRTPGEGWMESECTVPRRAALSGSHSQRCLCCISTEINNKAYQPPGLLVDQILSTSQEYQVQKIGVPSSLRVADEFHT